MTKKITRTGKGTPLPLPAAIIGQRIYAVRDQRVMVDSDLAALYQVETFNLNKAVKRNLDRFPKDFMFRLTPREYGSLTFQIGMSKPGGGSGGRRTLPYVFTEQGVAMLSSVLNSERAVQVNIAIMRAFVKLRQEYAGHAELAAKIELLEQQHSKHDEEIRYIFEALRELVQPPTTKPRRRIGFKTEAASG